jgi:GH24 family phage-related lysozyme (muramidase)
MKMNSTQKRAAALVVATALASQMEGLRTAFYLDPANIVTVCYGHTGPDINKSKVYSIDECKALLSKEMANAVSTVDTCRPGLPVNVLAAFADASYNIGTAVACDTTKSTAARMLASGDYAGACNQLPRWNKAQVLGTLVELPGLTKRRLLERDLCLS